MMRKIRATSNTLIERDCLDRSFGQGVSTLDFHVLDERLSRLLILLRQLTKSLPVLESIPEVELTEIVYGAIHLCGFVDPIEAEYAIENVLLALEAQSVSASRCSGWSEPRPPGITFHSDN
jgi:hypothetical protein